MPSCLLLPLPPPPPPPLPRLLCQPAHPTRTCPPCRRRVPAAGRAGELRGGARVPAGRPRGARLLARPACLGGAARRRRAGQRQAGPVHAADGERVGPLGGQAAWRCMRLSAACSAAKAGAAWASRLLQARYPGRQASPQAPSPMAAPCLPPGLRRLCAARGAPTTACTARASCSGGPWL